LAETLKQFETSGLREFVKGNNKINLLSLTHTVYDASVLNNY